MRLSHQDFVCLKESNKTLIRGLSCRTTQFQVPIRDANLQNNCHLKQIKGGAALAQWIRLCLPSCCIPSTPSTLISIYEFKL